MIPLHPILATAVVPWNDCYEFDEPVFRQQVETIATNLTRHIYIFGTAGEGYAVSELQFDLITKAFWLAAQDFGVSPMVGLISLSLPTVISRIERCHMLGFREFQLSLPAWGALNDKELDVFFGEICSRFTDCRFNHYNLLRTKRLLTSIEYRRLTAKHPNLVAVKSSTDDPAVIADLLTVSPRLKFYFTELGYVLARRITDEVGLLISLASVNHERARAFVAGDDSIRTAAVADFRLMLSCLLEISANSFHIDGAYDKMLFRMNDCRFPLRLLPPYAAATEADFERFRASLPVGWRKP